MITQDLEQIISCGIKQTTSSLAELNFVANNWLSNVLYGQAFCQITFSLYKTTRNVNRLWFLLIVCRVCGFAFFPMTILFSSVNCSCKKMVKK